MSVVGEVEIGGAFPVWRCSRGHTNTPAMGKCGYNAPITRCEEYVPCAKHPVKRDLEHLITGPQCGLTVLAETCHETRPCQACGARPARLYPNGMWCKQCEVIAPSSFVTRQPEPPSVVEEDRPVILVPQRRAEADELPTRLRALALFCDVSGISYDVTYAAAEEGGVVVESYALWALVEKEESFTRVAVFYQKRGFGSWLFRSAVISDETLRKGKLDDAKLALGMHVEPRKVAERKPREKTTARKGKADTLR